MRAWPALLICVLGLSGCGYHALQRQDEDVRAAWAEVAAQYRFRADLVPNLLSLVKTYARPEEQALSGVNEARARAGAIGLTPELLNDRDAFARFEASQAELTRTLRGLIDVATGYPQLRADANFRDLRAQLALTEARIGVARQRYGEAVRGFNQAARAFPASLTARMFEFGIKPDFTADSPATSEVDAGLPPPAPMSAAPESP